MEELIKNNTKKSYLLEKVLTLLDLGNKLKVKGLFYQEPSVPIIRVRGILKSQFDELELECIATNDLDTYLVEKPINEVDEIEVKGYVVSDPIEIDYVFMKDNQLYAALIDGTEVPYTFSIFDIDKIEV